MDRTIAIFRTYYHSSHARYVCILSDNYLHINGFGCNAYFRWLSLLVYLLFASLMHILRSLSVHLCRPLMGSVFLPYVRVCALHCWSTVNVAIAAVVHTLHACTVTHSHNPVRRPNSARPFKTCKLLEIAPILVLFVLAPC